MQVFNKLSKSWLVYREYKKTCLLLLGFFIIWIHEVVNKFLVLVLWDLFAVITLCCQTAFECANSKKLFLFLDIFAMSWKDEF